MSENGNWQILDARSLKYFCILKWSPDVVCCCSTLGWLEVQDVFKMRHFVDGCG